jgi:S1-C subfamily serine protease
MIARLAAFLALVLAALVAPVAAEDLDAVHEAVERALPREALEAIGAPAPLVLRRALTPRDTIYNQRVDGVVLLASTRTVATGVLVSEAGDIVTSDHIVQYAHRAGGDDWIAVWFRPAIPTAPAMALPSFLLARVVQRDARRDLARLRLAQPTPESASVIPLGTAIPAAGKKVFTIGHPKNAGWTFGEGTVAEIRPDYQWRYDDGVARTATAIQLAAPIATGSSGGPLFDDRGAMIGVVVGAALDTPGVGFAVAVQHVRDLLKAAESR